jgi:tetratricopeptide (TPR) repeat protein
MKKLVGRFTSRLAGRIVLAAILLAGCAFALRAALPRREVTTDSAEAYALYQQGVTRWAAFQFDAADSCWAAAVAIDPEFAMAWGRRAKLAQQRVLLPKAREYIALACADSGSLPRLERERLRWYQAGINGDTRAQRAGIEMVLRERPDDIEALFNLSELQMGAREAEASVRTLRALLVVDPAYMLAYNNLGYALADVGRFDEATEALQKYAFVNSDEANPHDSLGELYERIGRYDQAEAEYGRALEADSTFFWARMHLARLYCDTGRFRLALKTSREEVPGLSPISRRMLRVRTLETLKAARRYDEASAMLDSLGDSLMVPSLSLLNRAEFARNRGDAGRVDALRDSLGRRLAGGHDTNAKSADYYRVQARVLSHEAHGEWAAAADSLQAWLSRGTPSWDGMLVVDLCMAENRVRAGQADEAVSVVQRVLADNPHQAKALYIRAQALDRAGRTAEAVESWRGLAQALAMADPGHPMRAAADARLARAAEVVARVP